jgi:hypothetical protein
MKEEPGKLQIINYRVTIISGIIVVINLMIQWYQNQYRYIDVDAPMYIYKIQDAISVSYQLAGSIFIIMAIWGIISFTGINVYQVSAKISFKIVGILILTVIINVMLKSGNVMMTIDKHMYDKDRVKVANMVLDGKIGKGGKYEKFELPAEYKKVSRDAGQIVVRRENGNTWVYFTTYRGLALGGVDAEPNNTFLYCNEEARKVIPSYDAYTVSLRVIGFRKL